MQVLFEKDFEIKNGRNAIINISNITAALVKTTNLLDAITSIVPTDDINK